jgi:GGDEF domain-containing protein
MSRDHPRISAVGHETIVIDDLVGLATLDVDTRPPRITWANPAFSSLLARGENDLAGTSLTDIIDDPDVSAALDDLGGRERPSGRRRGGIGHERTVRLATSGRAALVVQLSATGHGGQVLTVVRAVHSTPRAAMYDAVTGLASLELFREHLQLGLNRRAREGDDLAVVAVSAANFGVAWQERAESASLLQTRMAERLEQTVRNADVLSVRRPGGFLLLINDGADAIAAATVVAERMLAAFETPLPMPDRLVRLDLRLGIAATEPSESADAAIARADAALAAALAAPPHSYRVADTV